MASTNILPGESWDKEEVNKRAVRLNNQMNYSQGRESHKYIHTKIPYVSTDKLRSYQSDEPSINDHQGRFRSYKTSIPMSLLSF